MTTATTLHGHSASKTSTTFPLIFHGPIATAIELGEATAQLPYTVAHSRLYTINTFLISTPPATSAIMDCSADIHKLSTAMRKQLPRELRDIIYNFVWADSDTLRGAHCCVFSPHTARSLASPHSYTPPKKVPAFLKPNAVDEHIRIELVQQFCKYTELRVRDQEVLERSLSRDLFQTGVSLSQTTLPSLTILTQMESTWSSCGEQTLMFKEVADLLRQQKLANDFPLEVIVQMNCDKPDWERDIRRFWLQSRFQSLVKGIHVIHKGLRALRRELAHGGSDPHVVIRLQFERTHIRSRPERTVKAQMDIDFKI